MSQSNNNPTKYQSALGITYSIQYDGILAKTGDNAAVGYKIYKESEEFSYVKIKISGTLIAVWNVQSNIEEVLIALGTLKIRELLEDEQITTAEHEFMFTTHNTSSQSFQEELAELTNNLDSLVSLHREWVSRIQDSFSKNQDLILEISKDHAKFQEDNSRELRNTLVQVVVLSAGIVAGVVTLGRDNLSSNLFALSALGILVGIVFFGVKHIFTILEDRSIQTFKSYKNISDRIETIKEKEFEFLQNPSIEGYNNIFTLWEKHTSEVKKDHKVNNELKKDQVISRILKAFALALILLIISFIKIPGDFSNYVNKRNTNKPIPATLAPTSTEMIASPSASSL